MSSKLRNLKFYSPNSKKKFHILAGINRPISPNHVTKLADSISYMGDIRPITLVKTNLIDGVERDYILDGQHLYHACLRNNQEFSVVYNTITSIPDLIEQIALLNASSKSWTMFDYICTWGNLYSDYKTLLKLYNTYDIDLLTLSSILQGSDVKSNVIKKGTFKIRNLQGAIQSLDYVTDSLKLVPRMNRAENRSYILAYVEFIKSKGADYNHKAFMIWGEKNKAKLALATQSREHISDLFHKSM